MKNFKKGLTVTLTVLVFLATMLSSVFAVPKLDLTAGEMVISVPDVTNNFQGDMPTSFSNTSVFDAAAERNLQYYNNDTDANKYLRIRNLESGGTVVSSDSAYLGFSFA